MDLNPPGPENAAPVSPTPDDAAPRISPRRPAPPRLRAGRPGARVTGQVALRSPQAPAATAPAPAPATLPGDSQPDSPRRRTLLLAGAGAAALALPVAGAALVLGRAGRGANGLDTDAALSPSAANPAQDALSWAHDSDVLPALPDGSFAPDAVVTRADLALALHRFAGAPTPNLAGVPTPVADVPEDPERAAAVLWLHGRGALWGDAELRVRPDEPATQEAGRGIVTALLEPALTGAGIDATTVLEAALTTGEGTTKGGTVDAAPLTRAVLATTLHSVDQALTS